MLIKVRTLTGKEIELQIDPEYKACPGPPLLFFLPTRLAGQRPISLGPRPSWLCYRQWPIVLEIKELVEEKEGIPPAQQRLIFGGKQMTDDKTAKEYNLNPGETLHLVLALRGGF
ncbi:hypothetical protein BROUX41_006399 [Berkeleyomyces rouxiae]|uniref:uncharacterized protein n=1 Tax=Berkeleyomyces rouxiae TaxID=2035830 RepID=UPI003B7D6ABD